jgi:hypothetical protein
MKNILVLSFVVLIFFSCKTKEKNETVIVKDDIAYATFGKEIMPNDALSAESMFEHYKTMKVGDSINSKMVAKVDEVCQAKGCWMTLNLDSGEQVMVKFKDYGFFMPKDIAGKEVVINGVAYVNEVPVEEQRHYAEDAGKSAEEIAKITKPKRTFSFEADGVLLAAEQK